jgi:hypothetical protein
VKSEGCAVILLTITDMLHTRHFSFVPFGNAFGHFQAALAHLESIIYDPFHPEGDEAFEDAPSDDEGEVPPDSDDEGTGGEIISDEETGEDSVITKEPQK